MTSRDDIIIEITPQVLLKAYSCGIFPMAESADDPALYWIEPQHRGILPLESVHMPRRLAHTVRTTALTRWPSTRDYRRRHRRLRRFERPAAAPPGSTHASARSTVTCSTSAIATPSRSGRTTRLVGGLYGVALGGRLLRREHVLVRARRLQDRAHLSLLAPRPRRLLAARYAVRYRAPCASSAPSRSTATSSITVSTPRSASRRISCVLIPRPRASRSSRSWTARHTGHDRDVHRPRGPQRLHAR